MKPDTKRYTLPKTDHAGHTNLSKRQAQHERVIVIVTRSMYGDDQTSG